MMELTLQNNGSNGLIYWMLIGQIGGVVCWIGPDGTATPIAIGDDCALYQSPINAGEAAVVPVSGDIASARVSFCAGQPLQIAIVADGNGNPSVQDAVFWLPTDANYDVVWDKAEFTVAGGQIWANTTQVDFFGMGMTISITDGTTLLVGPSLAISPAQLYANFSAAGSPWSDLVVGTARIISPGYGQSFPSDYLSAYIDSCWMRLTSAHPLSLSLKGATAGYTSAHGSVNASGTLVVKDNLGGLYHVHKPSSSDVFLCNGALSIDGSLSPVEQQVDGIIKRQIGAGLNRGVLIDKDRCGSMHFYKAPLTNTYSKLMHSAYTGHLCYGFAYDDVCNLYSSTLSINNVTAMAIVVD